MCSAPPLMTAAHPTSRTNANPLAQSPSVNKDTLTPPSPASPKGFNDNASPPSGEGDKASRGAGGSPPTFGSLLKTFGAVPVSGPNLYK